MYNEITVGRFIMYYGLIILSVAMFGGGFALNDVYRKMRGSSLRISMESYLVGSVAGLVCLLIFGGTTFDVSLFTVIMALIATLNAIILTFFTFKALDSVNLSLYSLFSMLGGMMLPFIQGIIFYNEGFTLAKAVAIALIFLSLALTVDLRNGRGGLLYCIGVFILNGLSGVITKLYNELPFEKASPAGYSVWIAIFSIIISGLLLLLLFTRKDETNSQKYTLKVCTVGAASGAINKVANFILVISLLHVETSVQYPLVTGGVIIVSTLICFFGSRKPTKRELLSVIIAFLGTLALFVIPL